MSDFQEFPKCLYLDGDVSKAHAIVMDADAEAERVAEGYMPAKEPNKKPGKAK